MVEDGNQIVVEQDGRMYSIAATPAGAQGEANARLIAAAPAMLAFLETEGLCFNSHSKIEWCGVCRPCQAHKLVLKARSQAVAS